MNPYSLLILLCGLVIFSYWFDILSRRTRIPSVLLLMLTGMAIRYLSLQAGIPMYDFDTLLPILGTVGLIMIVFEGALELKFAEGKQVLIRNAFLAALIILLLTAAGITLLLLYATGKPLRDCAINAIPFSVISSAIAIPSVSSLKVTKKEFIIYESSFSDILGIMVFNLILNNETFAADALVDFGIEIVVIAVLILVCCFAFLYLMGRMTHQVKFFLIFSALVLVYAVGKVFHLSTLVIILAFGLFLSNIELIMRRMGFLPITRRLADRLNYPALEADLKNLHQLSAESAFLLRTFFFLVFGYTLSIEQLFQPTTIELGLGILGVTYLLRLLYLRIIARAHVWPEVVISPRGLISVLLFLSIPPDQWIIASGNGLLIFTILASGLIMTIGLITTGLQPTESGDE